jgi:hypothetical protein
MGSENDVFIPSNRLDFDPDTPCPPENEWCRGMRPHLHGDYTCDKSCPCWGLTT